MVLRKATTLGTFLERYKSKKKRLPKIRAQKVSRNFLENCKLALLFYCDLDKSINASHETARRP